MQPYVIRQGDYVAKLAYSWGFDADAVWNDDKNSDLRSLRSDPGILLPGDILYIPDDASSPPPLSIETGTTNTFVADVPTTTITVKFTDCRFAAQSCSVVELEHLAGLSTDSNGIVTFAAPITLEVATIVFAALDISCACALGHLDPVDTLSGAFQRLQNLGYIDQDMAFDATNLGIIRGALRALRASATGDGGSGLPTSDTTDSTQDASPRGQEAASNAPAEGDTSDTDSQGASDSPVNSVPPDRPLPDDGVADSGELDEATRNLLTTTHGC